MMVLGTPSPASKTKSSVVSILLVMDDGLGDGIITHVLFNRRVSILLVMDDGLGAIKTFNTEVKPPKVSILLVMDDGLGVAAQCAHAAAAIASQSFL